MYSVYRRRIYKLLILTPTHSSPVFKVYLAIFWPSVHMIWPMELLQLHTFETWALTFSRNGRPGVVGCWSHSTTCRGEQTKSGKATVNDLTIPILCQLVQNFAHQQYLTDIPHIDTTILSCNLIRLYCYIIYATCHIHPHRFVKRKIWIS